MKTEIYLAAGDWKISRLKEIIDLYESQNNEGENVELFAIANSRGKAPVVNAIKKTVKDLSNLKIEMNDCPAKDIIVEFEKKMRKVLILDNPKVKIY